MPITGAAVTNKATGGQFFLRFRLNGPNLAAVAERVQLSFDEDPAVFVNAIKRWKDREFNKKLPMYANRVLVKRSGALMSSRLEIISTSHQSGGITSREGTTLVHLRMNMSGESKIYGPEQETGRAANTVKAAGHYLVPVASQWGSQRVTSATIRSALSDRNVRWLPYGNRYAQDKAGRPIKYVFRFDKIREKAVRGAAAAKRVRGRSTRRKSDVKESLREQGSMLFIAYKPPFTTGIPGASGGAFTPLAGKGRKITSPVVRDFGFSTIAGRQASRWFSYTLIKTLPTLDSYLKRETGALKGAGRIAQGTLSGGGATFYE